MISDQSINEAFSPNKPIAIKDLFAGRTRQLGRALEAIKDLGKHPIVFGARGVGKTSLANVVAAVFSTERIVCKIQCHADITFEEIIRSLFDQVHLNNEKEIIGFTDETKNSSTTLSSYIDQDYSIYNIVKILSSLNYPIVFIVDEFDRTDRPTNRKLSDFIKALSDQSNLDVTVMIVGVSDTLEELVVNHPSVERNIDQIHMHAMTTEEILSILDNGERVSGITISSDVKKGIVRFTQGSPYYAHLLGQKAARSALSRNSDNVESIDLKNAVKTAHESADHTIRREYNTAVASSRKTTFPEVLYAAALSSSDEFGFFRPSDMAKVEIDSDGRMLKVEAMQYPISKLISKERGAILIREGETKRYRYRFKNPMMKQYILLKQADEQNAV